MSSQMKVCNKCHEEKPITEYYWSNFYQQPNYTCKECEKIRQRTTYDNLSPNQRKSTYLYQKTVKGRISLNNASKRAYIKHKEKWITRAKTRYAVKMGKLVKLPCFCGELKVHAHHTDYTKPLEVMWLCQKHHVELHNKK